VAELGAQLKRDTRLLLQLLSRQAGLPAARRLLELLEAVPPWRAADVVAAALARNSQVRRLQHCRCCTSSAQAGVCAAAPSWFCVVTCNASGSCVAELP
jgi:hypothetical protein